MDLIEILIQSRSQDNFCQDPTGYPGSQLSRWYTLRPILRNLANKQTDKQKIWQHRGSNSRPSLILHNSLTDWALGPYQSYYSDQITIIRLRLSWIWLISWSNQDLQITVIRIQQDILDRNPVVEIHYLLFWEILPTNKQTNRETNKKNLSTQKLELSTLASLAQCPYRLSFWAVLSWLLLSLYYYQIHKKFWPHRGSNSRPSRF